jgi:hypothetical protein
VTDGNAKVASRQGIFKYTISNRARDWDPTYQITCWLCVLAVIVDTTALEDLPVRSDCRKRLVGIRLHDICPPMVILTTLLVLMTWMLCAAVLIGIGSLVLGWFSRNYILSDAFWIGLALTVGLLQIWHCFGPINLVCDLILVLISAVGIALNRSRLLRLGLRIVRIEVWAIVAFTLIVTSLAIRATGPCEHFDTGLYGATTVRWILSYPIIPGLAKLHGRLGFNSSVFLCIAALGQGIWRNSGHHLFTGLLVSGFWATAGSGAVRVLRGPLASPTDWFHSILLIPCVYWTTHSRLVGTMTDLPASILCLVATGILFGQLELTQSSPSSAQKFVRANVAMTLLALAVTFKLSTAVFSILVWLIGLVLLSLSDCQPKLRFKLIGGSIFLSAIIILPWLARGVILSGYPFYPEQLLGANVDWKVSPLACRWELAWIRSWARAPWAPLAETQGFHWLRTWLHRNILDREGFQVPLVLSTISGIGTLVGCVRSRFGPTGPWLWLLLPSVASLTVWFLEAPAPRFAEAPIWTMAGVLSTAIIVWVTTTSKNSWLPRIVCLGIILTSAWCIAPHRLWRYVYNPLFMDPQPLPMPQASVVSATTTSGLTVYWRADGLQCWDAPLPCTPYFDKTLRLRRAGDIRSGFSSDWPETPSDLANTWARPNCSLEAVTCALRDEGNRDHGGE